MKRKYDAVVFDVDGTLLDTTEGVAAAVEYTIAVTGLKPLKRQEILTFIGPPVQDSFRRIYGIEGERLQELATVFRDRYKEHELLKAKPYEGIYEVLDQISGQGIPIAVATYKRQDYAETILKHFGFEQYTSVIYGADHENKLKKVDIIVKCLQEIGVADRNRAVMVGDSSHDALGAEQVGMHFLGVTYGFEFHSPSDVMQYAAIGSANTPIEILPFIIGEKENLL